MEYFSRDICQDRFVNSVTDTDRAPIINNYLANKSQLFATWEEKLLMLWVNIGILTNLQTQTNLRKYVATTLLIIVLDETLVQSGTVVHAYLDDSKGKLLLFTWKVVTNLYVVNS